MGGHPSSCSSAGFISALQQTEKRAKRKRISYRLSDSLKHCNDNLAISLFMVRFQTPDAETNYRKHSVPVAFLYNSKRLMRLSIMFDTAKGLDKTRRKKIFGGLLVFIALLQSLSYMSEYIDEGTVYTVYQSGNLSGFDVSNGEYLPMDSEHKADTNICINELTYDADSIQVNEWHREDYAVVVSAKKYKQ